MSAPLKLSKADARRAMVRHHFAPCATVQDAFHRLRSVQFDPIAPAGCNHDLVLQARVHGYKVGDWEKLAYRDRFIYDGWDKQASLVPMEGWPVRRLYYDVYRGHYEQRIFQEHKDAVEMVLKEITERGPMQPKDFKFQARKEEWKGSWYGPSVTKQVLRGLWHSGLIMTADRKKGQHVYDLTERIVPLHLLAQPQLSCEDAQRDLVLERHRAVGLVRMAAPPEMWSYSAFMSAKRVRMEELAATRDIVPVEVEGQKCHATPAFLALLDQPSLESSVSFVAPLDQLLWDRKMVGHLFGFDYVWEIYTPEAKRRWGYYVLPVRFGDELVARVEFWARAGTLEIRRWHFENGALSPSFFPALEEALRRFMSYSSTERVVLDSSVDPQVRKVAERL